MELNADSTPALDYIASQDECHPARACTGYQSGVVSSMIDTLDVEDQNKDSLNIKAVLKQLYGYQDRSLNTYCILTPQLIA